MDKTEKFIEKARKVHGDRYDYSRSVCMLEAILR